MIEGHQPKNPMILLGALRENIIYLRRHGLEESSTLDRMTVLLTEMEYSISCAPKLLTTNIEIEKAFPHVEVAK